jgi:hypothetical protein
MGCTAMSDFTDDEWIVHPFLNMNAIESTKSFDSGTDIIVQGSMTLGLR